MTDLQQFHAAANAFLQLLELPAANFAPAQDVLGIDVNGRFSVRLSAESGGAYLFQGNWRDGVVAEGAHVDWLMANQISPGALQPVMAIDEHGKPSCWMRVADTDPDGLVNAFDMLVDKMDQMTPQAGG